MKNKIKVALINPPVVRHLVRGTGVYASSLYKELEKINEMEIIRRNFGEDLTGFDLVHYPYFDPFFLTLKLFPQVKTVVTVHDLIPLKYPDHLRPGLRGRLKWFWQKRLLGKAVGILTDSLASKADIENITGISPDKIKTVYLGVNKAFKKIKDNILLEKAGEKLNLPKHFLLTVGDVNWNKNISNLIRAYALVHEKDKRMKLVLVGKGFITESAELSEILNLTASLGLTSNIIRLADLSIEDLICVYNLADLFILPSFAEGFGLPLLEAYACQCPALCTKEGSLSELAGNSAVFVEPENVSRMGRLVLDILLNKAKKQEMIANGLKRVSTFSWQKCAQETLSFYKQVLA